MNPSTGFRIATIIFALGALFAATQVGKVFMIGTATICCFAAWDLYRKEQEEARMIRVKASLKVIREEKYEE